MDHVFVEVGMIIRLNPHDRTAFWNWCNDLDIACEYMGFNIVDRVDSWYIRNEKHRMLAILKWL